MQGSLTASQGRELFRLQAKGMSDEEALKKVAGVQATLPGTSASKPVSVARARMPEKGRTYVTEGMNKTEAAYSGYLEVLKRTGKILEWRYERMHIRLADNTFYIPDFFVVMADGSIEIHEVKGHWEDDARVKIKVAASENPWFTFVAVKKSKTGWTFEWFGHAKKSRGR